MLAKHRELCVELFARCIDDRANAVQSNREVFDGAAISGFALSRELFFQMAEARKVGGVRLVERRNPLLGRGLILGRKLAAAGGGDREGGSHRGKGGGG